MTDTNRPALPVEACRKVWAQATDARTRATLGLLLLAGLRVCEVQQLHVADYIPPRLRVGDRRPRTIAVAPSCAGALEALPLHDGPLLLPEASTTRLVTLVRAGARQAGVEAGVHDLRHAAIAAAIDDGTPIAQVQAYFGITRGIPAGLRQGWDRGVAAGLEAAFC